MIKPWIGVDVAAMALGVDEHRMGPAIPLMVSRMAVWIRRGVEVRIISPWSMSESHKTMIRDWIAALPVVEEVTFRQRWSDLKIQCVIAPEMYEFWSSLSVRVAYQSGAIDNAYIDNTAL